MGNHCVKKYDENIVVIKNTTMDIHKMYFIGKQISNGGESIIKQGLDQHNNKIIVKIKKNSNDENNKRIDKEIEILNSINHPNIIQILDSIIYEDTTYIILENLDYKDYFNYIKVKKISEIMLRQIVYEILLGLKYIHDREIIHYDIKPENLMIKVFKYKENGIKNKKPSIKIIDFGLSQYSFDILNINQGTKEYLSPEILINQKTNNEKITNKIDVWGLGIIIYMSICKKIPFQNIDITNKNIDHYKYLVFPNGININIIDFCKKCLIIDPSKRPSINELFLHPWINCDKEGNLFLPVFIPDPILNSTNIFNNDYISEPDEITSSFINRLVSKSNLKQNNSSESYVNSQTYDSDNLDILYNNCSESIDSESSEKDNKCDNCSNHEIFEIESVKV